MFDKKVRDYFGLNTTKGDVGIEVEAELSKELNYGVVLPGAWRQEGDGSLRGWGYEFVLKKPVYYEETQQVIDDLHKHIYESNNNKILSSIRAGVHIHINVQDLTIRQMLNFLVCYYIFETALTKQCGKNREGNLFCMRNQDADYTIQMLERAVSKQDMYLVRHNNFRYAAMNFQSLFDYGSLESRALATEPSLENIKPWIDMLMKIKSASLTIDDPWTCIDNISGDGASQWAINMLGEEMFNKLDYPEFEIDVMRNLYSI